MTSLPLFLKLFFKSLRERTFWGLNTDFKKGFLFRMALFFTPPPPVFSLYVNEKTYSISVGSLPFLTLLFVRSYLLCS